MAGEKLGYLYSAYAGADLTGKEGMPVVISGASNGLPVVTLASAGAKIDGVISVGDVQNATVRIVKFGVVMMKVGDTIAAQGEVEVGASGVITKATGVAIGKILVASAAAGDIVPVFVY